MTEDRIIKAIEQAAGKMTSVPQREYVGVKNNIRKVCEYLMVAMFPSFAGHEFDICKACLHSDKCHEKTDFERRTSALFQAGNLLMESLAQFVEKKESEDITEKLITDLPKIKEILDMDIQAAYEGDPAANSKEEVILAYPSFPAICIYRIAHKLYELKVPVIPRIMTEYAHELTGIDIHPGATIGKYFFIDHGTGVVIGETTTIGEHVKLYQHVTLGAKSFDVNPDGSLVKGIKRHPDIGNRVVIYAGATILGGKTKIGDDCVIGGNVWLTHSVEPGKTVKQ